MQVYTPNSIFGNLRICRAANPAMRSSWLRGCVLQVRVKEDMVGKVRPMLLALLGAVSLIVLIVSLNIANLLLARASRGNRRWPCDRRWQAAGVEL